MPATLSNDVLQDDLAVTVACAIATANRHAQGLGIDVSASRVSVAETHSGDSSWWRVSYGPRDYLSRRGGDTIIEVEPNGRIVKRVMKGQ